MRQRRSSIVKAALTTLAFVATAVAVMPAQGVSVQIAFANGRVTLTASDAPVAVVLTEWARVGRSEILGIDTLASRRVTLDLSDVTEAQALAAILGDGVGFVSALKTDWIPTQSRLARIRVGNATAVAASEFTQAPKPPEAMFEYFVPENAANAEVQSVSNPFTVSPDAVQPEATFHYFVPEAADPRVAPSTPAQEVKRLAVPPTPEKEFQYFVPELAAAPKKPPSQ
jgi:hypothetical protein